MADNAEQEISGDGAIDANSDALALIAAKLAEAGVAPDGDYDIAAAVASVIESRAQLETELSQAKSELQGAQISVNELKRSLTAQKGQTTKARKEAAAAAERDPDAKARTLPDDVSQATRDERGEVRELIGLAEAAEIVAFSGKTEILSIAPFVLRAGGLREVGDGLVLSDGRWVVHGPSEGAIALTSWGLYADGELVAWRERPAGQLTITAGSSFDISHDVIF